MRAWAALLLTLCASAAAAQTVSMSGRLGERALLMIDGQPRTVAVGHTVQGVKLVSVTADASVVELGGKGFTVPLGGVLNMCVGVCDVAARDRAVGLVGGTSYIAPSTGGGCVRFDTGATSGPDLGCRPSRPLPRSQRVMPNCHGRAGGTCHSNSFVW